MVATMEWPKPGLWFVCGLGLIAGIYGALHSAPRADYVQTAWLLGLAFVNGALLVRIYRLRNTPGARLDENRLETLRVALDRTRLEVTPLEEVAGIAWESPGYVALRLRSGEIRTIGTRVVRRRDRASFVAALHGALAVRGAA